MAKSDFTKLGTADSLISAHINGIAKAVNRVEDTLGYQTTTKSDYVLTPVADQDDVSQQYRIYESNVGSWVNSPTPTVKRNGATVDPGEYVLYAGYGAVVFHVQQAPEDVITANFTHLTGESELASQVETNRLDIEDLQQNQGGGGGGFTLPFPIYVPGQYRTPAIIGSGASYRGTGGMEQLAHEIILLPLFIPETITFDRIGTNNLTPGGGGMWLLVYKDNGSCYPGQLEYSVHKWVGNAGLVYGDQDFTLEPGLYWVGFHSDGKQGCQGVKTSTLMAFATDWNPAKSYVAYRTSTTYNSSTPRNPFPTGATMLDAETREALPAVFVRRKA